jgi:predicted exporter
VPVRVVLLAGKGKRLPLPAVRDVPLAYLRRAAARVAVMSNTDPPDRAAGRAQITESALEQGRARNWWQ